jgi:hypothetical protein
MTEPIRFPQGQPLTKPEGRENQIEAVEPIRRVQRIFLKEELWLGTVNAFMVGESSPLF